MSRTLVGVVLFVLVVGLAVVAAARPAERSQTPAARVERIAGELRCPVCQGLSVADSPSITARDIRADIRRRITAGESDDEIRAAYVERYGQWILLRPRGSGFASGIWFVPVAAGTVAVAGLAFALRRHQRAPDLAASPEDEALVAELRHVPTGGSGQ